MKRPRCNATEFDDWNEFRGAIRRHSESDPLSALYRIVWRGQRDPEWALASQWERYLSARVRGSGAEREHILTAYQEVEQKRFLQHFRRNLSGLPGMPSLEQLESDEKVWAIGRHHGLITPLLDWSEKPYLALFFAVADLIDAKAGSSSKRKAVRISDTDRIALYRLEVSDEMTLSAPPFAHLTLVWKRYDSIGRLLAQRGLFTWIRTVGALDLETYLSSVEELARVSCFVLRGKAIVEALHDLNAHGIDWRQMFPDVHGAALSANALLTEVQ